MKLSGKKILVTGADGFIGSHLVQALMDRGCDVRAFVYYNSFNSWGWLDTLPPKKARALDVFAGDIRDPNGVANAMEGCDVVFHLAALIAIPFSYHSPDSYVDTNIRGAQVVEFTYRPWTFRLSIALAAMGCILVLMWALRIRRKVPS